jgi:hypothetical protein
MDQSSMEANGAGIDVAAQSTRAENQSDSPGQATGLALLCVVAGWALPGLGHLLLRKWGRAAAFFVAVAGLAAIGYAMRGEMFAPRSDGPFGMLGFLADIGCGATYFSAHFFQSGGPDLAHTAGDYGTRLLAAAGLVNVMAIVDVYEAASHREE